MGKPKGEEAESNTGMQTYYFITALMFGMLSLYCFMYVNNYGDRTCIKNDTSEVAKAQAAKKAADEEAARADQAALDAKFPAKKGDDEGDAAEGGLLRRILLYQMAEAQWKEEQEQIRIEEENREEELIQNGSYMEKLGVYKNRTGRRLTEIYEGIIKGVVPKRRLAHLSPGDQAALGALSQRMGEPGEFNLAEGTSQAGNALGMFICYAVQSALSFFIGSGMACYGRYLPHEIPDLNCCVRCYGGLVRKMMDLQIKLHYVSLVQVLLLWLGSLEESCVFDGNFAVLADGGTLAVSKAAGQDAAMLLQVTGTMWVFLHCIGGVIRSVVYIEPTFQIPDDPDENEVKVVLFQRCGP